MTKTVLEWLANPKNIGQMRDADAIGKTKGNENCKDVSKLFVKVEKGKISETKFQTYGGVASIVATSVLSEIIKGKTMSEVAEIGAKDIYAVVGQMPGSEDCVKNALTLIASVVSNYNKKQEAKKAEEKVAKKVAEKKVEKSQPKTEDKPKAKRGRPAKATQAVVAKSEETKAEDKPKAKRGRPAKVVALKDEPKQVEQKQEKPAKSSVTIIAKDNAETKEVEVDIFSEIDALTAKISEAVNKMKKK